MNTNIGSVFTIQLIQEYMSINKMNHFLTLHKVTKVISLFSVLFFLNAKGAKKKGRRERREVVLI